MARVEERFTCSKCSFRALVARNGIPPESTAMMTEALMKKPRYESCIYCRASLTQEILVIPDPRPTFKIRHRRK